MKALVTNDDGVLSEGIVRLANAVAAEGFQVRVVAPNSDMSGSGASIGGVHRDREIDYERVKLDGAESIESYSIDGSPALAVILSMLGAFGEPPEMVFSGINPGNNTGRSVIHSGTVGAVLTGMNFGLSGVAVSIGSGSPLHWETAATVAALVSRLLKRAPKGTSLNVNVPNLPIEGLAGVRQAKLAAFGTVRTAVAEKNAGKLQVELRSIMPSDTSTDTDTGLLARNFATITALTGVRTTDCSDAAELLERELRAAKRNVAGD